MKNKKKVIALSGAILAIAATIGIGTWIGSSKNNDTVISDEEQVESSSTEELPLVSEDGVNLTITKENLSKIENFMNSAGDMRIIKTITLFEENKETNELIDIIVLDKKILCNYVEDDYFISADALKAMEDPDFLDDFSNYEEIYKKHSVDMKEHFGIDMETLILTDKNYDILLKIAESYNINTTNLDESRLDKKIYDIIYEIEKQKLYYCDMSKDFDASIVNLTDNDYDKILNVTPQILIDEIEGNEYIHYLIITVEYEKNNTNYTRELTFELSFFGDVMDDCSCSDDSGCNTGTNDPCEEDCEMEDKIE